MWCGLVVSLDGKPNRKVVENGIDALKAIWHRGAVDADGKTGDGAGIHIQIPVPFFYDQIRRTGHEPRLNELIAVGQVFYLEPILEHRKLVGQSSSPKSSNGLLYLRVAARSC